MRFINRKIPIVDVARALDLRMDGSGKIHCWRPERHKHGDRSASVGIRQVNNTVKCFACDSRPMGPIDLAMEVRELPPGAAAVWIAERFNVPTIEKKRPSHSDIIHPVGYERGLQLLIRSGLFGSLWEATRSIAPALLDLSTKLEGGQEEYVVEISYVGITRYTGITSHNAIRKALVQLADIGFLRFEKHDSPRSPMQPAARYILTPNSDELRDICNAFVAQMDLEILAEKEVRAERRREKIRVWRERSLAKSPSSGSQISNHDLPAFPPHSGPFST